MLQSSLKDSRRIRTAAARRDTTISAFIRSYLRRAWNVSDADHKRRALERGEVRSSGESGYRWESPHYKAVGLAVGRGWKGC